MPRVTMGLTDADIENADHIYASVPSARTRAQAVSFALALTRFLVDQRLRGANLLLERNGQTERVIMPELERLTPPDERKLRQAAAGVLDASEAS
jgi:hypothetical protein